jgi:hypothetical protein
MFASMTSSKQLSSLKALTMPECATLLAINICACPMHPNEPIPCKDMEAWNKLQAEAGLEEQKTVLGWLVDMRRLLVQLPKNKFVACIIGKLGLLGMAIPFVHNFLSRLRNLHTRAKSRQSIPINNKCCKDL